MLYFWNVFYLLIALMWYGMKQTLVFISHVMDLKEGIYVKY